MAQNDLLISGIEMSQGMLKQHLADFSDADMMTRPVPGANHAAWQLAHLTSFAVMVANLLAPGKGPTLPAEYEGRFNKNDAGSDDASQFPSKAKSMEWLDQASVATVEALRAMSSADMEKPSPEKFRTFAPTVGHLVLMTPMHLNMHLGQFQVIRRKLGKPVLF